jgi:hypothetical protein
MFLTPNKSAVMAAIERVGAEGATVARLQAMTGVPIEEVRVLVKNRVSSGKFAAAMPAGTNPQTYVLSRHLKAFQEALGAPKANLPPPTQSLVKMTKTGAKSKPASKPVAAVVPSAQKAPRHCSGTTPVMQHCLPRMECARPGADAHAAIPSRRGPDLVPHQRPIHMCSGLTGGMK